jgi:hypothetical protein
MEMELSPFIRMSWMGPFRSPGHNSCASKAAVSPLDFLSHQSVSPHTTVVVVAAGKSAAIAVRIHSSNYAACLEDKERTFYPFPLQFED